MGNLEEIDVFIVAGLTFLFTYAIWGIDISVGAIGTGTTLLSLSGYMNPYDFYHHCLHLLVFVWFSTLGYFLIRFHSRRWKHEKA